MPTSLDEYYKRWEAKAVAAAAAADADDAAAQHLPPGVAPGSLGVLAQADWSRLRPEDVGVHIGRPLTEAEFAAHRAAGARVVTRVEPGGAADARNQKK